jgi:hypothetical protein
MKKILMLGLALAAGCATVPAGEPGVVSTEERRWQAAGLRDYRYDFEQQCFCTEERRQPVTVEVRGGRVVRVVSRATGREVPLRDDLRWYTVPELFARVAEARREGVLPLEVAYDPRLGYPTRIEAGSLAADAGVVYLASNLRPLD